MLRKGKQRHLKRCKIEVGENLNILLVGYFSMYETEWLQGRLKYNSNIFNSVPDLILQFVNVDVIIGKTCFTAHFVIIKM